MDHQKKRVAVIGAGIAGLACAFELQKAGCEVTVLEKNPRVGGRMASRNKDHFIFDIGADHLCDLYDEIKAYSAEFGIPWEKMRFLKYQILKGGQLISPEAAVSAFSKFRLGFIYSMAKRAGNFLDLDSVAEFDTDNAYDYMKRMAGKDVADYYVDPFTSTYQFHRATEISRGALMGIMRSIGTNPKGWYLHRTKGGMQALPDAFASRLSVKTNHTVTEVSGGSTVMVDGQAFDAAVLASTATTSLKVYKNPTDKQSAMLRGTSYANTVTLAFRVDRSLMPDTAVVWVPFVENQKISGYVNEAMKGEELLRDGKSLFCVWLHEDFSKTIIGKTDEEIYTIVKNELLNACPWFTSISQLENFDLERWNEAMPKFKHGHLKAVRDFMLDGQGGQNVFFCGDYLNGPWTEGALRNGKRVATQVITKLQAA